MSLDLLLIAGARPNFMKVAALAEALRRDGRLTFEIVHTGQHYDQKLSDLMFHQLGIPEPTIRLGVGSGSHAEQTASIMLRLEPILVERRPRAQVVVGDVNSTIAATLTAVKLGVRTAHVEAGLRSFDRSMPEEINRILTDAISEWLFVSEPSGLENLEREGVPKERIHFVGNVMIDTLLRFLDRAKALGSARALGLEPNAYALVTLHRPANVDHDDALREVLAPLSDLARTMPVVFPVHPRTKHRLEAMGLDARHGWRLMEPLGYLEFLGLMADARIVATDSGGVQEETTVLGVPCVTMRDSTERPVTITEGTNRLAGTSASGVRAAIEEALEAPRTPRRPEYWDGRAAERIVEVLATVV